MFSYRINQFEVESEFPLPCTPHPVAGSQNNKGTAHTHSGKPLRIEKWPSINEVSSIHWMGQRWWARSYDTGDGVVICVQDKIRLHIDREASRIAAAYDEEDHLASAMAGACIINLGMSVCSLLLGELALHGAAVEWNGRVVAFMAPSGTGKSTLLWALRNLGFRFVSDDVLIVRPSPNDTIAVPSYGLHSKLDEEGLLRQGIMARSHGEVLPDSGEYWIPVEAGQRVLEPRPLAGLFVLRPSKTTSSFSPITFNRQGPGSALSHVIENIQGLWAVHNVAPTNRLLTSLHELVRQVPFYVLDYPRTYDALPVLASGIKQLLEQPSRTTPEIPQPQHLTTRRRQWFSFPFGVRARSSMPLASPVQPTHQ
jgi:hypothetical protein